MKERKERGREGNEEEKEGIERREKEGGEEKRGEGAGKAVQKTTYSPNENAQVSSRETWTL